MVWRVASWTGLLLSLSLPGVLRSAGADAGAVQVAPEVIRVGLFYSGCAIRIKGVAPSGADVVVRVVGPDQDLVLNKKGKAYGVLWMTVGQVHYRAIPALYLVRSSRPLREIAPPEVRRRWELGFDALRARVAADASGGAPELFGELVKLKQRDGLFACQTGGIASDPIGAAKRRFQTQLFLPAKAPVGDYGVEVLAFRQGHGTPIGSATVRVERGAVVAFIRSLAVRHGLLYGCLAVAVAIFAGLVIGIAFGLRHGGPH